MSLSISGQLVLPNGTQAANAEIYFTAVRTSQDNAEVITGSRSVNRCDAQGNYSINIEYGRYQIATRISTPEPVIHGNVTISADIVAKDLEDLITLISTDGSLTDELLERFSMILSSAEDAADRAEKAADTAAEETAQKVGLMFPVNSGNWSTVAGDQLTDADRYKAWSYPDSSNNRYAVRGNVALPITIPATPDDRFYLASAINKDEINEIELSKYSLVGTMSSVIGKSLIGVKKIHLTDLSETYELQGSSKWSISSITKVDDHKIKIVSGNKDYFAIKTWSYFSAESSITHPSDIDYQLVIPDADNCQSVVSVSGNKYVVCTTGVKVSADAGVISRSNRRLQFVREVSDVVICKRAEHSVSAGVTLFSEDVLSAARLWDFDGASPGYAFLQNELGVLTSNTYNTLELAQGATVVYKIKGDCKIRFGVSNAASEIVNIYTSINDIDYNLRKTVDTSHTPSGTYEPWDVSVESVGNSEYYVKIENAATNGDVCRVVGLNFTTLKQSDLFCDYDTVMIRKANNTVDWISSDGANEFAMWSNGKWYGTYHGGHTVVDELYITDKGAHDTSGGNITGFELTKTFKLVSKTTITTESGVYSYNCITDFSGGIATAKFDIALASGSPLDVTTLYTSMTCSNPVFVNETENLGVTFNNPLLSITQFNSDYSYSITTNISKCDLSNSISPQFIVKNANYAKFYNCPVSLNDAVIPFWGGQWFTQKVFS